MIFSTLIYCSKNFEFLFFLNDWLTDNSSIIIMLENFNINILNYITGNSEIITN